MTMEQSFEEFINTVKKVQCKRRSRITNSYGTYDYYKYYRKNRPKEKKYVLSESQYFAIVRRINEKLGQLLVDEGTISFMFRMGDLEIRKYKIEPMIDKNGKLVYNAPIDWDRTLKLWHEDSESYKNKQLVKLNSGEEFKIWYNRTRAVYENKSFYQFRVNKDIRNKIRIRKKEGRMDAFESKRH